MEDVWEKIFQYLDVKDLACSELVCKEWRDVIIINKLWMKLSKRRVKLGCYFVKYPTFIDLYFSLISHSSLPQMS